MFRDDLFVTIAEIHMLILDVCVCLHKIIPEVIFIVLIIWFHWKR